jgi:hypothetical protein
MSIPRIFVHVDAREDSGWHVRVEPAADAPEPGPDPWEPVAYDMDSAEVKVAGVTQRVPVVPPGRRLPADAEDAEDAALIAGDTATIQALLDRLALASPHDHDVRRYGRWLFESLLAPAWQQVRAFGPVRQVRGVELALRWPATATDLHRLVWEAMHDREHALADRPDLLVAITRVVPSATEAPHTIERAPGCCSPPDRRLPRTSSGPGPCSWDCCGRSNPKASA